MSAPKHRLAAVEPNGEDPASMDAVVVRYSWTQPICEADWIAGNSVYDGTRLDTIRVPVRVRTPEGEPPVIEKCAYCGAPTIVGIYVRADPTSVPYPAVKT